MRLFVALDIATDIRERIARFLDGVRELAPDDRWVRPESLHVTLKFIGEQPDASVDQIRKALSSIESSAIEMSFRGYGFFPTAKAPRVFWIGIDAGANIVALAAMVDEKLGQVGIAKETHAYSAHLTLARAAGGSGAPRWRKGDGPNPALQRLQEKLAAVPASEFGTMTAHEFFLYQSQLGRGGSRYTKLAAFGLR